MKSLYEKIIALYPELKDQQLMFLNGTVQLRNDGQGDYIAEWKHPTLPKPTDEQLKGV